MYTIFNRLTNRIVAETANYDKAVAICTALGDGWVFDDTCDHHLPYTLCPFDQPSISPTDKQIEQVLAPGAQV